MVMLMAPVAATAAAMYNEQGLPVYEPEPMDIDGPEYTRISKDVGTPSKAPKANELERVDVGKALTAPEPVKAPHSSSSLALSASDSSSSTEPSEDSSTDDDD
jgi:hypothetical protein